jgi:geranylgeranyl pyrophosphate synthase
MTLDERLRLAFGPLRARAERALVDESRRWTGPAELREAMEYALFGDGKRVRPCLVLASCIAVGGDVERAAASAAALELIHTYSLVHDDLPAMDDDDVRRGRPTVHRKYDEALAILAGDALLTEAFGAVAADVSLPAEARIQIVATLAATAGAGGMVGGQVRDIRVPAQTVEALTAMQAEKTGALFVAACRIGAIAGDADATTTARIVAYGEALGRAFQASDDLLDFLELETAGGAHEEQVNLASLLGPEGALERVRADVEAAAAALGGGIDHPVLELLPRWILDRAAAAVAAAQTP